MIFNLKSFFAFLFILLSAFNAIAGYKTSEESLEQKKLSQYYKKISTTENKIIRFGTKSYWGSSYEPTVFFKVYSDDFGDQDKNYRSFDNSTIANLLRPDNTKNRAFLRKIKSSIGVGGEEESFALSTLTNGLMQLMLENKETISPRELKEVFANFEEHGISLKDKSVKNEIACESISRLVFAQAKCALSIYENKQEIFDSVNHFQKLLRMTVFQKKNDLEGITCHGKSPREFINDMKVLNPIRDEFGDFVLEPGGENRMTGEVLSKSRYADCNGELTDKSLNKMLEAVLEGEPLKKPKAMAVGSSYLSNKENFIVEYKGSNFSVNYESNSFCNSESQSSNIELEFARLIESKGKWGDRTQIMVSNGLSAENCSQNITFITNGVKPTDPSTVFDKTSFKLRSVNLSLKNSKGQ